MRIGIITFHAAHNYGAVLQTYATRKFLSRHGYEDVKVVDYRPDFLVGGYRIFTCLNEPTLLRKLKGLATTLLLSFPLRYLRVKRFNRFIGKYLSLSARLAEGKCPKEVYDVFITGSDQIWNPGITGSFDDVYFASFPSFWKNNPHKIAYAASMGLDTLSDGQKEYLADRLRTYTAIGVREKVAQELLQPLTDKNVSVVVDPTLLLSREEWDELCESPKVKQKYVLVYQVCRDVNTLRIARGIARQIGAKVIEISSFVEGIGVLSKKKQCVKPEMFLGYIREAACVVTTSFHGTVFSILYGRPFYAVDIVGMKGGSNSRLCTLLSTLCLEDRYIPADSCVEFRPVDYSVPYKALKHQREESADFLLNSLKGYGEG